MKKFAWGVFLPAALISTPLIAMPQAASMKDVLMGAMNSTNGTAEAQIVGPLADKIRAQIQKPDAKVVAKAKIIGRLPAEDCKVVEISFTTPGTRLKTPQGDMRDLDIRMPFNVCKNGSLMTNEEARMPVAANITITGANPAK